MAPPFDREQILGRVKVAERGETTLYERTLLTEVARLEQELSLLDRNTTVWHADDCGVWNANPPWRCTCDGSVLRDALAVAREREQRMREALSEIANALPATGMPWAGERARAALVDEPAADEQLNRIADRIIADHGATLRKLAEDD